MKLKILRLDFETFYDPATQYSLRSKKLNMSEFIRDKRFKAHGCSVGFEGEAIEWVSHKDLPSYFRKINWDNVALLCWNTHFDGLILQHHYGHVPAFYLDGMVMARVVLPRMYEVSLESVCKILGVKGKIQDILGKTAGIRDLSPELEAELAGYAIQDSQAMWDCYLRLEPSVPADELRLIDMTAVMFCVPVAKVNDKLVNTEITRLEIEQRKLFARVGKRHGIKSYDAVRKMLNSSAKLSAALISLGRKVPYKENDKGDLIPAFAKTDDGMKALLIDPDPDVGELMQARTEIKGEMELTRARRLQDPRNALPALPIGLHYGKPRTLRWSGANKMNPQNFHREGLLRRSIEAPNGYDLNVVDSSQIEDRMNCFLSGQDDVLEEYRSGGDPYKMMASAIYGVDVANITKAQRFVGKVARLQLGYQSGKEAFHTSLISGKLGPPIKIDREDSDDAHTMYRLANDMIVKFWWRLKKTIFQMQKPLCDEWLKVEDTDIIHFQKVGDVSEMQLPNGLSMYYPKMRTPQNFKGEPNRDTLYKSSPHGWSKIYEGKLCENINQALAKIVVANQILRVAERYRVVSTTHDEVWYLSPKREGLKALQFGLECFSESQDWYKDLPLGAEGGQAKNYQDAKSGDLTLEKLAS
ncbi:MAG: hypothetical protein DRI46_12285 [Chloroflexi bacterium]|nr:MAG: hypothetical protein DRI46_12285 [Chloroflexota bacterium]